MTDIIYKQRISWRVFLILQNSSLKLKTAAGNAILLNYAVSSENISESIKIKTENSFHLKVNVGIFRRNENRTAKQSHRRHFMGWGNLSAKDLSAVFLIVPN